MNATRNGHISTLDVWEGLFPPAVTRSSHKDHEQQTPYLSSGGSIGP